MHKKIVYNIRKKYTLLMVQYVRIIRQKSFIGRILIDKIKFNIKLRIFLHAVK